MKLLIKIFLLLSILFMLNTKNIYAENIFQLIDQNIILNNQIKQKIKIFQTNEKKYFNEIKKLQLSLLKIRKKKRMLKRSSNLTLEYKKSHRYKDLIQNIKRIISKPSNKIKKMYNYNITVKEKKDFFSFLESKINNLFTVQSINHIKIQDKKISKIFLVGIFLVYAESDNGMQYILDK